MQTAKVMIVSNDSQCVATYVKGGIGSLVFSKHALVTSDKQVRKINSSSSQMKVRAKEFSIKLSIPGVAVSHRAPMYHKMAAMMNFGRKTVKPIQTFRPVLM